MPSAGIGGGGVPNDVGYSIVHHQEGWLQGGHRGQTAPCSIAKTRLTKTATLATVVEAVLSGGEVKAFHAMF